MKFLIVLGLFPLFSASPYNFWQRNFQRQAYSGFNNYPNLYNNQGYNQGFNQGFNQGYNQRINQGYNQGPSLYNNQAVPSNGQDLASLLRELAQDPRTSQTINKVFNKDAVCLNNIEEAIEAVAEGSRLMNSVQGDLETLTSRVENLGRLTGEAEVVREVASIFRVLDSFITKMAPANPTLCSASSDSTAAYFNSLAVMMNEFSEDSQIDLQSRGMFAETASVLSATSGFLRQLKTLTKEFPSLCFSDKESSTRGIRAMGKIISSLADLSATLGNLEAAEEIRKGNGITEKIVTQIQNMKDLNMGFDCSAGDFKSAAATMDDLANIIQDVGIVNLKNQLGLDLDFGVIGQY